MNAAAQDRLVVVGAGKIGEALLSGLLKGQLRREQLLVIEARHDHAEYLEATYGVGIADVATALASAASVLIAVKPQDISTVLGQLNPYVTDEHLVVSVVAGISTAQIEASFDALPAVVRAMPNTAAVVGEAMTAIAAGARATQEHLARAEQLLAAVGKVVRVPENQLDAITALSGSGPAYFFFVVEAMIDAGVLLGLPRSLAADLIIQTAMGAAVMLRDTGEHPVQLREAVTSPAGTTISAIRELERHGVRSGLIAAIEAARDRSVVLGITAQKTV